MSNPDLWPSVAHQRMAPELAAQLERLAEARRRIRRDPDGPGFIPMRPASAAHPEAEWLDIMARAERDERDAMLIRALRFT